MTVTIEFWDLMLGAAGLLSAFFGGVWGFGKVLLTQIEKRLEERFIAQDALSKQTTHTWLQKLSELERLERENTMSILKLRADLPNEYVRREDWIRFSGVIDAKMDALGAKIDKLGDRIRG